MGKFKAIFLSSTVFILAILLYTRITNLSWGLPLPFHPDERNMAVAIQNLSCQLLGDNFDLRNCFNPQFFAYGQFPLYVSYFIVQVIHFFSNTFGQAVTSVEATWSLRLLSVINSVLLFIVSIKIGINLYKKDRDTQRFLLFIVLSLLVIYSPALIQFSHFGTTETILMFCYLAITLFSLSFINNRFNAISLLFIGLIIGIAVATKVSSVIFLALPAFSIFYGSINRDIFKFMRSLILNLSLLVIFSGLFSVLLSPQNVISSESFLSSMGYESDVALGKYIPFYSRQFIESMPVVFQVTRVFPYALGLPVFLLAILGFIFLPRTKEINILRLAFLIYFLPSSFIFAKWTRFMAPVFPILVLFAAIFIYEVYKKVRSNNVLSAMLIIMLVTASTVPGLAYLSVYNNKDVRLVASEWMNKNLPQNSLILSETANVVDIPIPDNQADKKNFKVISFNFYDLDENEELQGELSEYLESADYVLIPSRRVFANYTCLKDNLKIGYFKTLCEKLNKEYPIINGYYKNLFKGSGSFEKIKEFTSYPTFSLFGKELFSFNDELAEEGWTVFDHPVIRLYKRSAN